jgi:hypothetical protein
MDCPKILTLFGGNFWRETVSSKEIGELAPDPEWLDPDSIPELESCLPSDVSSASFAYLRHSVFNSWLL